MKSLPYYKEEGGAEFSGAISLIQNIDVLTPDEALMIANYMCSCIVIDEWLSNIKDVLSNKLVIPSQTWSDGFYVWDASHIHYVREYHARLPVEFVAHVKRQLECRFDPHILNKEDLKSEFNKILKKLVGGDESIYDGSY